MSRKLFRSLPILTGLSIGISATFLNALVSWFYYDYQYKNEVDSVHRQLNQLVATIEKSASVAVFLDNQELATEVVNGLANNDIVAGSSLLSSNGMQVKAGDISVTSEKDFIRFPIESPFFKGEKAGALVIKANSRLIDSKAKEAALQQVLLLGVNNLLLMVLVIFVVHRLLTRPIKGLAMALHDIEPGNNSRLSYPANHAKTEIGQLVDDANLLLDSVQNTLNEERRLREYVESVERRLRLIFEKASSGIALLDAEGRVVVHNPAFVGLFGLSGDTDFQRIKILDLFKDKALIRQFLVDALNSGESTLAQDMELDTGEKSNTRWLHVIVSSVVDEQGNRLLEVILHDVSERKMREAKAREEADLDPLTGLYNRRATEKKIRETIEQSAADKIRFAVMLIDLDKFKPVNDTYGHDAGDQVLTTVSTRLVQRLRHDDIVARWGGDEFLVVAFSKRAVFSPEVIAKDLLDELKQPITVADGIDVEIGGSIGIALFPDTSENLEQLIDCADQAMYRVKQRGRNGYALYDGSEGGTAVVG